MVELYYVKKALQSIFNQTFKEFEIVIVDDGSTDDSPKICRDVLQYVSAEVEWRLIEQPNLGVSTARNNGVKAAKCNYIAFLDADDWWSPTYLEEMKALITEFPEGALYASSYIKVKHGKNIPAQVGVPNGFEKGYFDYCKAYAASLWMPVWTGASIIKKSIFEEMKGFKPQLKMGEDFDLWVRVSLKNRVVFLNKPLAFYNQDVELQSRAIGNLHNPQTHFLFNLEYLEEEEKRNTDLKHLLDNLRVYSLFPYYLNKNYRKTAKNEFAKVDWYQQPKSVKRQYELPVWYLNFNYQIRKILSMFKTFLLKK